MVDTSDFILLVAALFIYSLLQLNLNSVLLNNNRVMAKTERDYTAVALAQNIADESREKAFDEGSVGVYIPLKVEDFSVIGPEAGEVYPFFDDIDDYNNYSRVDTTESGIYTTLCKVDYMVEGNLNQVSAVKTPYKRLYVQVISNVTDDTVAVTYIKSYY